MLRAARTPLTPSWLILKPLARAFFDRNTSERQPMHVGITLDLAAPDVQALALARLSGG